MSPDDCWALSEHAYLRRLRLSDAPALYAAVERNRERLRPWLGWVDEVRSSGDVTRFVSDSQRLTDLGPVALECGLFEAHRLVGAVGLNRLDWRARTGNLGYWIDAGAEGRGLVAAAARALAEHGLRGLGLARIEVRAVAGNRRSRRTAEAAGLTFEGTLRSAAVVAGARVDLLVYSLVTDDLRPSEASP